MKILDTILLAGLAIFTTLVVIFTSSSVGQTYPEFPKSNNDMFPCYMETNNGTILNLSSICAKKNVFTPNFVSDPNPNYAPTPRPELNPNLNSNTSPIPTPNPTFVPTYKPSILPTPAPTLPTLVK